MNLVTIFLLIALVALVALYVTRPFVTHQRSVRSVDQGLSALMAERDRILTALQELDFDHTLGKVSEEEYPSQREILVQRGAGILRQLDEHLGTGNKTAKSIPGSTASDDDLEDLIARRRSTRKEKTGGFCPKCGKPVLLSDRFCPKCGYSLK
jgi:ribosomal protein S27AE